MRKIFHKMIVLSIFLLFFSVFIFTKYFTLFANSVLADEDEISQNAITNFWGKITGFGTKGDEGGGDLVPPPAPPPELTPPPDLTLDGSSGGGGGGSKKKSEPKKEIEKEETQKIETHFGCINGACVSLPGAGNAQCDPDSDCGTPETFSEAKFCKDSDKSESYPFGDNPFIKGIIEGSDGKKLDNCQDEVNLQEWSCESYDIVATTINCKEEFGEKYGCVEGSCVEQNLELCFDSDSGANYFKKGEVTTEDLVLEDTCVGRTTLQEYLCDKNNIPNVVIYHCPSPPGTEPCVDGTCIPGKETIREVREQKPVVEIITGFFSRMFEPE